MKTKARFFLPVLAVLVFIGCTTLPTNWDSQVGQLSYFEAVKELGPPDKESKNADGQTVVEWVSRYPVATPAMDNDFQYHAASFGPDTSPTGWRESKLRLTFSTNNLLTEWSKD
jgi:hypothetical protein